MIIFGLVLMVLDLAIGNLSTWWVYLTGARRRVV